MASHSGTTLANDKAQHEALVQDIDEPESKITFCSLVWKPAVLLLIPLALTILTVYFGLSWTDYFQDNFDTDAWIYNNGKVMGDWVCYSNGSAIYESDWLNSGLRQSVWDTSQFLDITLGFGSFDFAIAKGIDIGWDLVIGRGGQIVLALLSYRVFSAVLLHSMETRAVCFYTYAAIGFGRGPLFSIWASLRDLWSGRSREKRVLFMVVYASLYLLAFPTFVSISSRRCVPTDYLSQVSTMTGYQPNSSPWVSLSNDEVMYPAQEFLPVMVLIRDGSRIGLKDGFPVAVSSRKGYCPSCNPFEANLAEGFWNCESLLSRSASISRSLIYQADSDKLFGKSPDCESNISCLVYISRLLISQIVIDSSVVSPSKNVSSTFMLNGHNISLPSPCLTFEGRMDQLWMHQNKTYTRDDMHGICQAGTTYQWGFSFLALLAFCITTTLYAVTMYSLWLRTYLHSRRHRAGQRLGLFKAVMDFSDALKAQVGEDCADKSEKQLEDLVNSHELGISCTNVDELPPPRRRSTWRVKSILHRFF